MSAAGQDDSLGAIDLVGEFVGDAGWSNYVVLAGHDEGWAADQPVVGLFRLRQRLARMGKALRLLAHVALASAMRVKISARPRVIHAAAGYYSGSLCHIYQFSRGFDIFLGR